MELEGVVQAILSLLWVDCFHVMVMAVADLLHLTHVDPSAMKMKRVMAVTRRGVEKERVIGLNDGMVVKPVKWKVLVVTVRLIVDVDDAVSEVGTALEEESLLLQLFWMAMVDVIQSMSRNEVRVRENATAWVMVWYWLRQDLVSLRSMHQYWAEH